MIKGYVNDSMGLWVWLKHVCMVRSHTEWSSKENVLSYDPIHTSSRECMEHYSHSRKVCTSVPIIWKSVPFLIRSVFIHLMYQMNPLWNITIKIYCIIFSIWTRYFTQNQHYHITQQPFQTNSSVVSSVFRTPNLFRITIFETLWLMI
jgi:hypothetical protein